MISFTFDSLGYAKKLEKAGFTRQQAEVQTNALREHWEAQINAFQRLLRKKMGTKGDVQDVRLEIEKFCAEMEKIRAELKADIKSLELRILKWQFGIGLVLAAIMAKGFVWLGF